MSEPGGHKHKGKAKMGTHKGRGVRGTPFGQGSVPWRTRTVVVLFGQYPSGLVVLGCRLKNLVGTGPSMVIIQHTAIQGVGCYRGVASFCFWFRPG